MLHHPLPQFVRSEFSYFACKVSFCLIWLTARLAARHGGARHLSSTDLSTPTDPLPIPQNVTPEDSSSPRPTTMKDATAGGGGGSGLYSSYVSFLLEVIFPSKPSLACSQQLTRCVVPIGVRHGYVGGTQTSTRVRVKAKRTRRAPR